MIQILPVTEPSFIERLNKIYNTNAKYAYVCVEKKEIKASILYNIQKEKAEILNVSTVDEDIFDGLVRAVFARLIELGIDQAEFNPKTDAEILKNLGFVQDKPFFTSSLREIIENCKKCKNS